MISQRWFPGPRGFLLILPFFIWKFATRSADQSAEPREKKASGQDRQESHFHAGSALDSCQRCHFLLTNHKGGSNLQLVDRAGWVISPVLTTRLLRRERRRALAVFTSCQNYTHASRKSSVEKLS